MDHEQDWNAFLDGHPVLDISTTADTSGEVELSMKNVQEREGNTANSDGPIPSGRRQVMVIKDSDLIVAAGSEIRIASLTEGKSANASPGASEGKSYKILHTPNIAFEIRQMVLNPNAKFLAVAGDYQVAVVVLPRASSTRLASTLVDCKTVHVGPEYHNPTSSSAPIAKVDWHPWGDGGTTLMVMTIDGKLREYDIATDTEEPQQVLTFVPQKKSRSYMAEDESEREVASFTIGKGKADWGPLTVYTVMKSGDIYAICPYMPQNAAIPPSYIHALECFVAAKQEFLLTSSVDGTPPSGFTSIYDYQHKYVAALLRQLAQSPTLSSHPVSMHPPSSMKNQPVRQGPFLMQPAPRLLEGVDSGDATDIVYLAFNTDDELGDNETERLGVILVAYQEGKVDVFLDVEKVEARWERKMKHKHPELPMLAVYESIDLGLASLLSKASVTDLLKANYPVFVQDPIHDESIYVYHAFGVHALQLGPVLQNLANALREDASNDGQDGTLATALDEAGNTGVRPVLTTFSSSRKCSHPVVAVAIPHDVYVAYNIFVLTSAMRMKALPLSLQAEGRSTVSEDLSASLPKPKSLLLEAPETATRSSFLQEPFEIPAALSQPTFKPTSNYLPSPRPAGMTGPMTLSPDGLRYFAATTERAQTDVHEVMVAFRSLEVRMQLQRMEMKRQIDTCAEMLKQIKQLKETRRTATQEKVARVQAGLKTLLAKEDRILNALMKKASPELSESETKWFQELKRMRMEIKGAARYDSESLSARTATLRREFDRLMPNLKDLKEKEVRLNKITSGGGLGVSQAFELGQRCNADRARITSLAEDVQKLATKLDVGLARPPALQAQV